MTNNATMHNADRLMTRSRRQSLLKLLMATLALFVALSVDEVQAQNPLNLGGDFRVRHETTTKQQPTTVPTSRDARNREVVRFRLGINKKVNDLFNFGARLATGSPDDPNTTDITLGDFVNDLTISLDRAYIELTYKNLFLTGGKFANPFRTTELLWDGDVNLQGFGGSYTFSGSKEIIPKLTGVYFIIDEQTSNPDSYMLGSQLQFAINPSANVGLTLSGAYYDYTIKSLVDANSGDIGGNFLTPDGKAYLSDFDFIDAIAAIDYRGFGERFPFRVVADFVKNRGAASGEDEAYSGEVYLGKVAKKNDWRIQYGYALAENDGVLSAFSHDNTTLASNYEQHTLGLDYVVQSNTILNLTLYHYRRHNIKATNPIDNDFFTRVRLNALVTF